jgi:hypothetical protein
MSLSSSVIRHQHLVKDDPPSTINGDDGAISE